VGSDGGASVYIALNTCGTHHPPTPTHSHRLVSRPPIAHPP
jgi:hypothetical protein